MSEQKKIQWHPAFCYAMRLELRDESGLDYTDEFNLTDKPLAIDLLVVKKDKNVSIHKKIGKLFKQHNIIEYKSPDDALNIDTIYKSLAYACLYKVSPKHVNEIDANDITITLVRDVKPEGLIETLRDNNINVTKEYNGIYYISNLLFDIQLIVSSELDDIENKWMKALSSHISKTLYISLYDDIDHKLDENEKKMADVVTQLVSIVNRDTIQEWKERDGVMCEALKEIMKPEIDEAVEEAVAEAVEKTKIQERIKVYYEVGKSPEEIAEMVSCSLDYVKEVLNM